MNGAIIPTYDDDYETDYYSVLIPDEWGNHSDEELAEKLKIKYVLIPDEWGNHSDEIKTTDDYTILS